MLSRVWGHVTFLFGFAIFPALVGVIDFAPDFFFGRPAWFLLPEVTRPSLRQPDFVLTLTIVPGGRFDFSWALRFIDV